MGKSRVGREDRIKGLDGCEDGKGIEDDGLVGRDCC